MKKDVFGLSGGVFGILFVGAVMAGSALTLPSAAVAQPSPSLNRAIRNEMKPIITDEDRALIARKCGDTSESRNSGTSIRSGVLVCSNGREVDDPEVRAMAGRVGERARIHVRKVMDSPGVRAAMNGDIERRVKEATRRIRLEHRHELPRALARFHGHGVDHAGIRVLRDRHLQMTHEERTRLRADLDRLRQDLDQLREDLRRDRERAADPRR